MLHSGHAPEIIKSPGLSPNLLNSRAGKAMLLGLASVAFLGFARNSSANDGGYPWSSAKAVPNAYITWWVDANGNGKYDSPSEQWDAYGFNYRNCTSYVAWRVNKEFGINIPAGWGNATTWDDNANGKYTVTNTPEPGDIAVWDGTYGHVAFVETVNSDNSSNVSEYNWHSDGTYDVRTNVRADHYIDLNGVGVGLNGQLINSSSSSIAPPTASGPRLNHSGITTIGVWNPNIGTFDLRNTNTPGWADWTFGYGNIGQNPIPIIGDWDGNGTDTIGLYYPSLGTFDLRNSNNSGWADITFQYGNVGQGAIPLAGDWNGDGIDTIGLYYPYRAVFDLRNSNSSGNGDISVQYGNVGAIPLTGDWNNDGIDTIAVYNPGKGTFDLRDSNTPGWADKTFQYGNIGAIPLAGDWDGNGYDSIGVYYPSRAVFDLKNYNGSGYADITVQYGNLGAKPIVGDWDGR